MQCVKRSTIFNKLLLYFTFNYNFACFSKNANFENILEEYCIQQTINNVINNKLT